nr:SDR family NAD(P)-dependent oxidoreductase [Acinetobacter baumannii]
MFTGASASLRGKAGFAHFSSAKAGLRMLSQAMAKEFGPQNIHVAHVVIDGIINGEKVKNIYPDLNLDINDALDIKAIAESYWQLHVQDKSAWTHELDLRPYSESF